MYVERAVALHRLPQRARLADAVSVVKANASILSQTELRHCSATKATAVLETTMS
jgi:hypothetical protein